MVAPGEQLRLRFMYDRHRYDDTLADGFKRLETLLDAMVAQPDCRLSELSLLTETERMEALAYQ